jgi:hypothetical protein
MARQVSNVDIITDSFEIWLLQTNELLNSLSTEIMTANATYANTGNSTFDRTSQLYGTFGANNLVVTNWLKGGNVNGSFANLYISTNTNLSNTSAANINLMVSNSTVFSYVNPHGGYFGNTTANSFINSTAIITQSNSIVNTNISPTLIQIANSTSTANTTATSFKTGLFTGNTISVSVGANVIANAESLTVGNSTVNTFIVSNSTVTKIDTDGYLRVLGNADFSNTMLVVGAVEMQNTLIVTGAANLQNTLGVVGAVTLANTIAVTGNATLSNTLAVTGNTTLSNTLAVTGATMLSNTIAVTGNTTLSNTLAVTGAATFGNTLTVSGNTNLSDYVTFDTDYAIQVESNTNLGATTGSLVLAYRFPKATFSSAKITAQVKNTGNTQISEMVLAHDGTDAFVTVFGTVASPGFANNNVNPLATFAANVNGANVDLLINQSVANSAAKFIAHLIK